MSEESKITAYFTPEMERELKNDLRKIRHDYSNVDKGYDDLDQLQKWRVDLSFIHGEFTEEIKIASASKIYHERYKDTARANAFQRILEESKASKSGKKTATAIKEEVGNSTEYVEWSKKYAKAYSRWEELRNYHESINVLLQSLASHIKIAQSIRMTDAK